LQGGAGFWSPAFNNKIGWGTDGDRSRRRKKTMMQSCALCRYGRLFGGLAVAAFVLLSVMAGAQNYPTHTVRIVVPFPAGGLNDTAARLLQPHLEKALGQTVIVDNRPGASGAVGTDAVAKATPDGHMLVVVASSHTVTPATNPKLPYNTERDLAPIAMIGKNPLLFVVNAKVPAKTLPEFVTLAKQNPGKFNYSSPGAASQTHLVTELLSATAGIKMQHIPYRGGTPAILAVVQDDAQFSVISPLVALPHLQAGTVRAIAAGSLTRDAQFPDLPTVAESGYPGFEAIQWVGILTAAGTPKPVIDRINAEVNRAIRDPDLVAKLALQGVSPAGGTPEEFQKLITTEIRNWTAAARTANIKME
jgi:tripartite-type tricarboxylate transporter receptor subunit TctC